MRILFISDNFPPECDAAAARVHERAVYWARWGHEVTVITSWPSSPQGRVYKGYRNRWYAVEWMDGIRVVRVKTFISANRGRLLRILDLLSFLPAALAASFLQPGVDVVAATSPQFFAGLCGHIVGLSRRTPFVLDRGDIWPASIVGVGAMRPNWVLRMLEGLELFLDRGAEAIVVLTGAFKANLVSRSIPAGKIAVVRSGVDLARFSPRPRDAELAREWGLEGKFVIAYIGTHGTAHGLKNVLAAAGLLRESQDIRILMVGDGAERQMLLEEIDRGGITNVVMKEGQPRVRMRAVWSLCDVALVHLRGSPVFSEVTPSGMFEAMAMGKPLLVAAPDGEARRIIESEDAGLWVPPDSPASLAAAITLIRGDHGLRDRLAKCGLGAACRHDRRSQAVETLHVLEIASARWGKFVAVPEEGGDGPKSR